MNIRECDRCGVQDKGENDLNKIRTFEFDQIYENGGNVIKRMDLCLSCKNMTLNFMMNDLNVDGENVMNGWSIL